MIKYKARIRRKKTYINTTPGNAPHLKGAILKAVEEVMTTLDRLDSYEWDQVIIVVSRTED